MLSPAFFTTGENIFYLFKIILGAETIATYLYPGNLNQGSLNLILEGRCPADFSSNLPQQTCLEVSSIPSMSLISWFRCV